MWSVVWDTELAESARRDAVGERSVAMRVSNINNGGLAPPLFALEQADRGVALSEQHSSSFSSAGRRAWPPRVLNLAPCSAEI
jgi:hypothetical protein